MLTTDDLHKMAILYFYLENFSAAALITKVDLFERQRGPGIWKIRASTTQAVAIRCEPENSGGFQFSLLEVIKNWIRFNLRGHGQLGNVAAADYIPLKLEGLAATESILKQWAPL